MFSSKAGTAAPKNGRIHMNDFAAAARRIVDDYLEHNPVHATLSGLHDFDNQLPDLTLDGFAAAITRAKAYLASIERYPTETLTTADQIDRALLVARFESDVRDQEAREPHRHNPSIYPDIATIGVYSILAHDYAPLRERLPALEKRLAGIPQILEAAKANLTAAPALWRQIATEESEGGIAFLEADVGPLCRDHPQLAEPLERAIRSFRDYASFLSGPFSSADGVSFALGRQLFDERLRNEHLLPFDCDSLLAFGERAVRETIAALDETAKRIDPTKRWDEIVVALRTDHPDERSLLREYRRSVEEARRFVADNGLLTLPTGDRLDVVETPPFMRPTVPYAAYLPPGPFESRQCGLYYVTPIDERAPAGDRAESLLGHNRAAMLLTTVHEAYPGHHVQLVKANIGGTVVRKIFDSTVLIEGWALYCEQMVLDEGMTDDPRVRLFQLKDQLWRACRVVIDVKLHVGEMTVDDAVDMLVTVAKLERTNAVGEVRRYTHSPTQPMSYLTGKQQILELRDRERARLGADFRLRDFHDRLLAHGSIPVSLIERAF